VIRQGHDVTQTALEQMPIFSGLPPDEAAALLASFEPQHYRAGTVLFHEGERGDRMFVVLEGEITVVKDLDAGEQRVLAVRGAGEFVGEMSFLTMAGRRTAGALVTRDARLLELTRADFDALLRRQPALAYEMLRIVSDRLRESNEASVRDLREMNRQLAQAYAELQAAQARLVEQERLAHEMRLARDIQESMHPAALPALPGYDVGARIVPAREIAGDFFDVFPLGHDTLGVLIGDVCGKGVPAALYMAQTRSLIRVEAGRGALPAEVLRRVNRHLIELTDSSSMFVTVLYGVLHGPTRTFVYARAGHELPLLWHASGELATMPRGVGHPLGMLPDPAIDTQTILVRPGATLLLYTDGATEAAAPDGEFFGKERLGPPAAPGGAQALCDALARSLELFRGSAPQADDITLVALRGLG
jgi:phosphoserine phosphatase RsbU/P